ncbi:Probable type I restriction enzyme BthVORF4518P M protein [Metamycoplasma cloacale]|uniref:site-specific DNA-methyltransferase (adenine-specific) n=1 Tax=Metamycoplasma cloacale TaxID=92401 RepID=A0A2Z4LM31_9BACT|nr:type I restriction-modification system subunit M [Metamycoplasma cloacale]AWX42786.1 type I restriction-modification system subunit M [Metamycoplasma cloacale]VEU79398.1 Probable type I restriction enzyme BthVORF4518P M protein [Metamycoplasma cloacale]
MADNKREFEKNELFKRIFSIANDLRGTVDGWDFKSYVLVGLFYRFLSENFNNYINKREAIANGNDSFNYADLSDDQITEEQKKELINVKGFFIKPSHLFQNVVKNQLNDPNLNIKLFEIFKEIDESSRDSEAREDFAGLFVDFNISDPKLGSSVVDRNNTLKKLLQGIASMELSIGNDVHNDLFGDAYEYLLGMYASSAGKSGGEFFTPQEVSELLVKIATHGRTSINKIYDMCCGSGSLLLKAIKVLGIDNVKDGFYGQEIQHVTYNLCRINMFLHDVSYEKFNIKLGNTLLNPMHHNIVDKFDVIVSNPPYSIKWDGENNPTLINDPRFAPAGVLAPKSKGDFAFIMHALYYLDSIGTAAIVCFPGIFYRSGAEEKIRQYLVDNNFVDCIIQLPDNLFFGTSIATTILVLKKSRTDNKIQFIDASSIYTKAKNQNKLSPENIEEIFNVYKDKKDVEHISKLVDIQEVARNNYSLSVSKYVEIKKDEEVIDIKALNQEIKQTVKRINELRNAIDEIVKELEND